MKKTAGLLVFLFLGGCANMDIMITDNGDGGDVVVREPLEEKFQVSVVCSLEPEFSGIYDLIPGGQWVKAGGYKIWKDGSTWKMTNGTKTYTAADNGLLTPPAVFSRTLDYPYTVEVVSPGSSAKAGTYSYVSAGLWTKGPAFNLDYCEIRLSAGYWALFGYDPLAGIEAGLYAYYEVEDTNGLPPKNGWSAIYGGDPAPTLEYSLDSTAAVALIPIHFVTPNADLYPDTGIGTAVYMSLFNGKGWMDIFTPEEERTARKGELEDAFNLPITTGSMRRIQEIVAAQLSWLQQDGVCSRISASVRNPSLGYIEIDITAIEPNDVENRFKLLWNKQEQKLASFVRTPDRHSVLLES